MLAASIVVARAEVQMTTQSKCEDQIKTEFLSKYDTEPKPAWAHGGVHRSHDYAFMSESPSGKCYYVVTTSDVDARAGWPLGRGLTSTKRTLFIAGVTEIQGEYHKFVEQPKPSACYVGKVKCKSEAQWQRLVDEYIRAVKIRK